MSGRRIDPDDGEAYTYEELAEYYKGKYKTKEIDAYWEECRPVRPKGGKGAGAASPKSPNAKVKLRADAAKEEDEEEEDDAAAIAEIKQKVSNAEIQQEEETSRFTEAINKAKSSLAELQRTLTKYDEEYKGKATETASAALSATVEKARHALNDVSRKAAVLKDTSREIPTKALGRALAKAGDAVDKIKEVAESYDDKHKLSSNVRTAIEGSRENCMTALGESSHYIASVAASANAQLQGVNDGLRARVASIGSASSGFIFARAADIDQRFNVETKAVAAGTMVADKAKELDAAYNVVENASALASKGLEMGQGLDARVTGGKVTPVVLSAYEAGLAMATGSLNFVAAGYAAAKQEKAGPVPAHG